MVIINYFHTGIVFVRVLALNCKCFVERQRVDVAIAFQLEWGRLIIIRELVFALDCLPAAVPPW